MATADAKGKPGTFHGVPHFHPDLELTEPRSVKDLRSPVISSRGSLQMSKMMRKEALAQ
ncbi:MAG: hypothetical protein H7Z11_02385 [Verrucomicrobia bacterium]|nr:hypothetical protein [Leptolyngbya sp. ES-bin-22]